MKGRIFIFLFVEIILINSSIGIAIVDNNSININIKNHNAYRNQLSLPQSFFYNESELIDEFTWSVMRYDHVGESENFGTISMPKPSPGMILVPTNMMSIDVCKVAVSIYHENKMNILSALEKYDLDHMAVGLPLIFYRMFASSYSMPCYGQKSSVQEMKSLAERMFWADLVGDCYSQSAFNTAILRLCGFSPEEVFTLLMPGHAVSVVQVEGQWYVFDSVQAQFSNTAIYEKYQMPAQEIIYWLENDKYFINFGTPYSEIFPYQDTPYSNIDSNMTIDITEGILSIFNNSVLGGKAWNINNFIEEAIPCPEIISLEVPNNVEDAQGSTIEERAQSLLELNKAFIKSQTGGDTPNQYDRSYYALGDLSVEYPQAYANAARYATWTSWLSNFFDSIFQSIDYLKTYIWIKILIEPQQTLDDGFVAFSDFSYIRQAGSSIDQAIAAYGSLRNMNKRNNFWQPEELYVILTENSKGYLAVNIRDSWIYLNFGRGRLLNRKPPDNIRKAFNEIDFINNWYEYIKYN